MPNRRKERFFIERTLRSKRSFSVQMLSILVFATFSISTISCGDGLAQRYSILTKNTDPYVIANGTYVLKETLNVGDFDKLVIENASVTFDTSDNIVIRSYDNAIVRIANSEIKHAQGSQVIPMHSSVISVINSTIDILISYDYANASITQSVFDIVHGYGSSSVSISDTRIRFIGAYDTSLVSVDNSKTDTVYCDSATISIDNSTVNSLVDVYGSSLVSLVNSKVSRVCLYGDSIASVGNTTVGEIVATGSTFVSVFNSSVQRFFGRDASIVNSRVSEIELRFYSDSIASLTTLPTGLISYWNLYENNTITKAYFNLTIQNSAIDIWSISAYASVILPPYGSPIVSVVNSSLNNVHAYFLSFICLVNCSIKGEINVHGESEVYVGWFLDIQVLNVSGVPVDTTSVMAYWQNGTLFEEGITAVNGHTRLVLYEKLMTEGITYQCMYYSVKAIRDDCTCEAVIKSITRNIKITMTLLPPVILGDLNADGKVNVWDLYLVARAFGTEPGDSSWNPVADLDKNSVIDIIDLMKIAKEYGKKAQQ